MLIQQYLSALNSQLSKLKHMIFIYIICDERYDFNAECILYIHIQFICIIILC